MYAAQARRNRPKKRTHTQDQQGIEDELPAAAAGQDYFRRLYGDWFTGLSEMPS